VPDLWPATANGNGTDPPISAAPAIRQFVPMPGVIAQAGELRQSAKMKARTMAELTIEDIERLAARY
jgi:hypothetical protein